MREALLYEKLDGQKVRCALCAHRCLIAPDKLGICRVRQNRQGELISLVYGQAISQAVDPIEKKPLFHFLPGTEAFSVATVGCNFRCSFCQNAEISQMPVDMGQIMGRHTSPEQVVAAARREGCASIAYTYTEPTVAFEYTYDISRLAHHEGLKNVYVTNGYMTGEMLQAFHPLLDAANVDLKAFRDAFYREQCGARLQPVLDTLVTMKKLGIWIEVTTLIIPTLNDDEGELRELATFIAQELGPETPWHVSRFHPAYRLLAKPPTPAETLHRAAEIGRECGLHHVYEGNIPGQGGEDTRCPSCQEVVVRRRGFAVLVNHVQDGRCPHCGEAIAGVWR